MDVKNTKELLHFVMVVADAMKESNKDGKINFFDIPKLIPIVPALRQAVDGAKLVPEELKDMDPVEAADLAKMMSEALVKIVDAVLTVHA